MSYAEAGIADINGGRRVADPPWPWGLRCKTLLCAHDGGSPWGPLPLWLHEVDLARILRDHMSLVAPQWKCLVVTGTDRLLLAVAAIIRCLAQVKYLVYNKCALALSVVPGK